MSYFIVSFHQRGICTRVQPFRCSQYSPANVWKIAYSCAEQRIVNVLAQPSAQHDGLHTRVLDHRMHRSKKFQHWPTKKLGLIKP